MNVEVAFAILMHIGHHYGQPTQPCATGTTFPFAVEPTVAAPALKAVPRSHSHLDHRLHISGSDAFAVAHALATHLPREINQCLRVSRSAGAKTCRQCQTRKNAHETVRAQTSQQTHRHQALDTPGTRTGAPRVVRRSHYEHGSHGVLVVLVLLRAALGALRNDGNDIGDIGRVTRVGVIASVPAVGNGMVKDVTLVHLLLNSDGGCRLCASDVHEARASH